MPQTPPPAQPVEQFQFQAQQQEQQQGQYTPVYITDSEQNETTSRSSSDNVNNVSGSLSNIQVNNNIDSFFQYERGVRIPTTTLTISGYGNKHDYGAVVSINIPLGGGSKKLAKKQIASRIEEVEAEVISRKLRTCSNIEKDGYVITDYAALNLRECQYMSRRQVIRDTREAVGDYQDTIRKQQVMIDKLLKRLDRLETENGSPFRSRG